MNWYEKFLAVEKYVYGKESAPIDKDLKFKNGTSMSEWYETWRETDVPEYVNLMTELNRIVDFYRFLPVDNKDLLNCVLSRFGQLYAKEAGVNNCKEYIAYRDNHLDIMLDEDYFRAFRIVGFPIHVGLHVLVSKLIPIRGFLMYSEQVQLEGLYERIRMIIDRMQLDGLTENIFNYKYNYSYEFVPSDELIALKLEQLPERVTGSLVYLTQLFMTPNVLEFIAGKISLKYVPEEIKLNS